VRPNRYREDHAVARGFSDDFDGRELDTEVPEKAASTDQPEHIPQLAVDYVRAKPL
jgi:hypothetical protein